MKKCPYCAEEIQDEAIICRYCRRHLEPYAQPFLSPDPCHLNVQARVPAIGTESLDIGSVMIAGFFAIAYVICVVVFIMKLWRLVTG